MKSNRRGHSLIEVLVILAGVSMLLTVSAGLLHVLFKLDRIERTELAETATIGRLSRQFRQDAHASERAEKGGGSDAGETLAFVLPSGETIRYGPSKGWLVRTKLKGKEPLARDEFRLSRRGLPRFSIRTEDDANFVSLWFAGSSGGPSQSLRRELRYEAAVGRELRMMRRPAEEARR